MASVVDDVVALLADSSRADDTPVEVPPITVECEASCSGGDSGRSARWTWPARRKARMNPTSTKTESAVAAVRNDEPFFLLVNGGHHPAAVLGR